LATTTVEPAAEPKATIPQTGVGTVLPLAGVGLAAVAIGLTRKRLLGR